jgi:hypothetical protein
MTVTTNERNQQNIFAKEPKMYVDPKDQQKHNEMPYAERAELLNSRFAMIGFVSGVISYIITGNFFFGIF